MSAAPTARILCCARFLVPLPPVRAIRLFTPEGERAWVDGWNPQYAVDAVARGDGDRAGTVFTTRRGGQETIWVALGVDADETSRSARYARTTPGHSAGTVTVLCRRGVSLDETVVEVRYDLSPLSDAGAAGLSLFAADYEDLIAEWKTAIDAALRRGVVEPRTAA